MKKRLSRGQNIRLLSRLMDKASKFRGSWPDVKTHARFMILHGRVAQSIAVHEYYKHRWNRIIPEWRKKFKDPYYIMEI